MNEGAPQVPPLLRLATTPLPTWPPTPKAPLTTLGTTAMAWARWSNSRGIDSGVFRISVRTLAALKARSCSFPLPTSALARDPDTIKVRINEKTKNIFLQTIDHPVPSNFEFQIIIFSGYCRESCSVLLTHLGRLLPGALRSDLAENKIACIHDEFTLLKSNQGTLFQSVNDLN
jgi:hypothetical protein